MYTPIEPFSPYGEAPKNLTYYLTRINPYGVKVTNEDLTCTGKSGCLVQLQNGEKIATSTLYDTHAKCQGEVTSETNTTRYTGICQHEIVQTDDNTVDAFLTECKSNRNDFILINYNKDSTNFTTSGNARALISEKPIDFIDLYKTSQSVNEVNADVYVYCLDDFKSNQNTPSS